jgi:lipid II:glycine glycyltransferase (peptidoglycan interpeptide bridge formation enzyme)
MKNLNQIATHPLQTSYWADFRRKWGNEVLETDYGILTLHKLPFSDFRIGVFEKGPIPTPQMIDELKKIGRENKLVFIKLEPNHLKDESVVKLLGSKGAVPGKRIFTPSTFWIDLTPSEDDLLKTFSSKTRYNIRVAQKHGVTIKEDNSDKAFDSYLELTEKTASRQGFYAHSKKYHKLMWETLKNAGIAHLLTATYKNKIITAWVLFKWKDFLYYPYGASSEEYKQVMANNLMMLEAIKFGKKHNLQTFDLWGREEGKGFTKFKEGYNPKVIEFLGTWDLVINKPLYELYKIADTIRWKGLKTLAKAGLSRKRFND